MVVPYGGPLWCPSGPAQLLSKNKSRNAAINNEMHSIIPKKFQSCLALVLPVAVQGKLHETGPARSFHHCQQGGGGGAGAQKKFLDPKKKK
jgi:hypothetical protein